LELEFHGAAREVTGSCHILRVNGHTVLLDCGLFQGRRRESDEKNRRLPLPVEQIDAIVLSHAHIDHAGRLPFLVRHGYANTIWATAATRDLSAVMLADSAHIQEKDAEFLSRRAKEAVPPLYEMRDAARVTELMVGMPYRRQFDVVPGVKATFLDAGHILGSAVVVLECTEGNTTRRIVFSGDVGRWGLPIIRDPQSPQGADVVIMESTYGNRDHESVDGAREHLARVVRETAARGGRILIPAFAVGRTQELVYDLHALRLAGRKISGPLLDRIDLHVEVTPVAFNELSSTQQFEKSESIRERVIKAREIQEERYKNNEGVYANAQMSSKQLKEICVISTAGQNLLKAAMEKLNLSARAYDRILKVSRTIADLAASEDIKPEHLAEAIQYRSLDREGWTG
jgi:metallo-beta-lactamase family protein